VLLVAYCVKYCGGFDRFAILWMIMMAMVFGIIIAGVTQSVLNARRQHSVAHTKGPRANGRRNPFSA